LGEHPEKKWPLGGTRSGKTMVGKKGESGSERMVAHTKKGGGTRRVVREPGVKKKGKKKSKNPLFRKQKAIIL